ncbi:MAG: DUF1786 domain-containing protein [Anaerolineales bacterium]|jgi:uncharacterized protein (DUF1786 family)
MKILTIDVGTGTQDIYLYDSELNIENGYKLILPSPTMIAHRKLKEATRRGDAVVFSGVMMGGGPSQWAAEEHIQAGYKVFATPDAAQTFNDDLDYVASMGIEIIAEEDANKLPESVERLIFQDFDCLLILDTLRNFSVDIDNLAALAIAVFDHGAAPKNYSDRQFRFDYLSERMENSKDLSTFAFLVDEIPLIMARMQAVAKTADCIDAPLVLMDTAPAAVLGSTFDTRVSVYDRKLVVNVGNFHTIAFKLGSTGIEGIFEHHTGFLDTKKIDELIRSLADGDLTHEEVFNDRGHGTLILTPDKLNLDRDDFGIVVTGPRRNMMRSSTLRPYFAAPFGDMMITGCFGLLAAVADLLPDLHDPIMASLLQEKEGSPPWESE